MNPSLVNTFRSLGEASVNKRALIPMARRGGGRVDSGSMEWWVVVGEDGFGLEGGGTSGEEEEIRLWVLVVVLGGTKALVDVIVNAPIRNRRRFR